MQHGSTGVWFFTEGMAVARAAEFAQRVESLGYTHLWLPETTGRDPFAHIAWLAARTERLAFATGIANIYHRHPGAMHQAALTLAEQTGGRFLLGLGVSHAPLVAGLRKLEYKSPVKTMREYLAAMDASPYSGPKPAERPRTVLAALGPKMLALAAEQTDGAHPYWTTPEHTHEARAILGPGKLLCVEQKVVLETDAARARAAGRAALRIYAALPNYRNNWLRMGYGEDDLAGAGSDRLIDGLVAWGDAKAIRERLQAHRDAGATHVCIQPLKAEGRPGEADLRALEELAPSR